jgi:hypothetical protein
MDHSVEVGAERRARIWRSVAEKRQIVKQTLEPGASVALIARAHGLNANQVFQVAAGFRAWRVGGFRRISERYRLIDNSLSAEALSSAVFIDGCPSYEQSPRLSGGGLGLYPPGKTIRVPIK